MVVGSGHAYQGNKDLKQMQEQDHMLGQVESLPERLQCLDIPLFVTICMVEILHVQV